MEFIRKSDKRGYSYYMHKYGIVHVHEANKHKSVGIQSAVDKNSFFVNWIYDENPNLSAFKVELDSDYKNMNERVLVSTKYGYCKVIARSLLKHTPSITTAVNPDEFFKLQAKDVHAEYNYDKVKYVDAKTNVIITCLKEGHGDFKQTPSNHIHSVRPQGCPICGRESTDNYNRKSSTTWSYSSWLDSAKKSKDFDSFKCYIIFCWDDEESFYKIGRTYHTLKKRFGCKSLLPYKYCVIELIESNNALEICMWEKEFKKQNDIHSYVPSKPFKGMTECYKEISIFDYIRNRHLICGGNFNKYKQ